MTRVTSLGVIYTAHISCYSNGVRALIIRAPRGHQLIVRQSVADL